MCKNFHVYKILLISENKIIFVDNKFIGILFCGANYIGYLSIYYTPTAYC